MSFNPYQPPASAYDSHVPTGSRAVVTQRIVESLSKTRPWVMVIAVLGAIAAALLLLLALVPLAEGEPDGAVFIALCGGMYLCVSIPLLRYGTAINRVLHGGGVEELERAVEAQATFWRVSGLLVLVGVVLGLLVWLVLFVSSMSSGFH